MHGEMRSSGMQSDKVGCPVGNVHSLSTERQTSARHYHCLREAQLSQRKRATRYLTVSWNLVDCWATVRKNRNLKRFAIREWPWGSFKVIGNGKLRHVIMYHFLLVWSVVITSLSCTVQDIMNFTVYTWPSFSFTDTIEITSHVRFVQTYRS